MTKHTAEDYARAEFARHEDGRTAVRWRGGSRAWETSTSFLSDADMAVDPGWSIVRDAESLTAREHLELAWDAAIVPEDGTIPAGAAHISRWGDGNDFAYLEGRIWERAAVEANVERRLLDPPAPAWHRAQIIRARRDDDHDAGRWARMDSGRWVCLDGESAGIECAPVDLRDVTVIVEAEQ